MTTMKFFYYQRISTGAWSPRKSPDRPDGRGAEGKRHSILGVIELPPEQWDLSITDLQKIHPLVEKVA